MVYVACKSPEVGREIKDREQMSQRVNFVVRACDYDFCSVVWLDASGICLYHPVTLDFGVMLYFFF